MGSLRLSPELGARPGFLSNYFWQFLGMNQTQFVNALLDMAQKSGLDISEVILNSRGNTLKID